MGDPEAQAGAEGGGRTRQGSNSALLTTRRARTRRGSNLQTNPGASCCGWEMRQDETRSQAPPRVWRPPLQTSGFFTLKKSIILNYNTTEAQRD